MTLRPPVEQMLVQAARSSHRRACCGRWGTSRVWPRALLFTLPAADGPVLLQASRGSPIQDHLDLVLAAVEQFPHGLLWTASSSGPRGRQTVFRGASAPGRRARPWRSRPGGLYARLLHRLRHFPGRRTGDKALALIGCHYASCSQGPAGLQNGDVTPAPARSWRVLTGKTQALANAVGRRRRLSRSGGDDYSWRGSSMPAKGTAAMVETLIIPYLSCSFSFSSSLSASPPFLSPTSPSEPNLLMSSSRLKSYVVT